MKQKPALPVGGVGAAPNGDVDGPLLLVVVVALALPGAPVAGAPKLKRVVSEFAWDEVVGGTPPAAGVALVAPVAPNGDGARPAAFALLSVV